MTNNTFGEQHHYFTRLQAKFDDEASTSSDGDEPNFAFFNIPLEFSFAQGWGLDTILEEEHDHEDINPPPKNIDELRNAGVDSDDEYSTAIDSRTGGQASGLSSNFPDNLNTLYALVGGVTFTNAIRNSTKRRL